MSLFKSIAERQSVRKFKNENIPTADLKKYCKLPVKRRLQRTFKIALRSGNESKKD